MYSWRITAIDEDIDVQEGMQIAYTGEAVEVMFERAPKYMVVLEERNSDGAGEGGVDVTNDGDAGGGEIVRSTSVEIFCKYVRREIRSLFDDERDQMFDAMKVWCGLAWCRGGKERKGKERGSRCTTYTDFFFFFLLPCVGFFKPALLLRCVGSLLLCVADSWFRAVFASRVLEQGDVLLRFSLRVCGV